MKSILSLTAAVLLSIAVSTPAYACDGDGSKGGKKGRHGKAFERFDKNGDGALTSDEVPERAWKKISKADADGDGAVTKAELKAAKGKRKGRRGGKRKRGGSA